MTGRPIFSNSRWLTEVKVIRSDGRYGEDGVWENGIYVEPDISASQITYTLPYITKGYVKWDASISTITIQEDNVTNITSITIPDGFAPIDVVYTGEEITETYTDDGKVKLNVARDIAGLGSAMPGQFLIGIQNIPLTEIVKLGDNASLAIIAEKLQEDIQDVRGFKDYSVDVVRDSDANPSLRITRVGTADFGVISGSVASILKLTNNLNVRYRYRYTGNIDGVDRGRESDPEPDKNMLVFPLPLRTDTDNVSATPLVLQATKTTKAVVQPIGNTREPEMEGTREQGSITFFFDYTNPDDVAPIRTLSETNQTSADIIVYRDERYRALSKEFWDRGPRIGYTKIVADRVEGQ